MHGRPEFVSLLAPIALAAVITTPSVATAGPLQAAGPSWSELVSYFDAEEPTAEEEPIEDGPADVEGLSDTAAPAETDAPAPVDVEAPVDPAIEDLAAAPEPEGPADAEPSPRPASTPADSEAGTVSVVDATAVDRKSGEHLRPRSEAELLGKHPVELGTSTYKPGTGLTFESRDGRFSLATRLRAQFLYTLAHDDEGPTHGLQIRRARLQFKGHVFNEHNRFKTELALSPRDMGFDGAVAHRTPILDWYFDFTYLRDLTVRIGQYKVPFSRQRVVSSGDLQLVDRSIANSEFNLDRDIGLDIRSKDFLGLDKLRYYAGVYFGEGRDQFETSSFDMFYLARVEVLPFGMFKDYKEADFERSLRPRLSLGAAYAFVDGAVGNKGVRGSVPSDGGTTDYHNATADVMFKLGGFSLFSDVYYRQGHRNFGDAVVLEDDGSEAPAPRERARNGIGWSGTAGYLIPRLPLEIAARYGQVGRVDSGSSLSRKDEAGGGVSYYIAGHPLKLQFDYFARSSGRQVFASESTEHVVRLQLQAAF